MNTRITLFAVFASMSCCVHADDAVLKIESDGVQEVTAAVQAAVDKVSSSGGGRLTVPAGEYVVMALKLKSGVELHLEEGAKLLSVTNPVAYAKARRYGNATVLVLDQRNVSITGPGTIDGRGGSPLSRISPDTWYVLRVDGSKNILIEDVTLLGSSAWTCKLTKNDGVTVRRVKIHGHAYYCNDGIDINSRNVLVEDCDIDAEDDAIVLKTLTPDFPVENVTVRRCRLASNSSHIKFGTETCDAFRNIRIYDCSCACRTPSRTIKPHDAPGEEKGVRTHAISGIEVSVVDGGSIENVVISNIVMGAGMNTPVFVRLGRRKESMIKGGTFIRDVLITDVRMTEPATSAVACSITGVEGLRPTGIILRNMDLLFPGNGTAAMAADLNVREVPRNFPMPTMFKKALPAYGIYMRHVDGVRLENVKLRYVGNKEARPAIVADDATFTADDRCEFQPPADGSPAVRK